MCILPCYVNEILANALNSRMYATEKSSLIATTAKNVDNQSRKLLRSYPEVVGYLVKKVATDKASQNSMQPSYDACNRPT